MKRFKQNPLRDIILIIVVAAISIWVFKTCSGDERVAADLPTYNEVQEVRQQESKTGEKYAEKQYTPAPSLQASGIPKAVYDSVMNALGIEKNNVTSLTLLKGKMSDSLKLARLERDEANNKIWKWEKTYKSGSKSVATMNERDSVLHQESDLKVAAIDREEGKGNNKRYYVDFYPLDSAYKFNGAYVFRKEQKEIKDIFALSAGAEFRKDFLSPNAQIQTDLNLKIAPDSKLSPTLKVGGIYDVKNGLQFFYGGRVDWNFLRVKSKR